MHVEMVGEIAFLRMAGGKANAINATFLGRLTDLLDEFEQGGARAAVMTGYDRFFSAGLDLVKLHGYSRREMTDTLTALHHTLLRIYACPLPVVAAVNGHAIAGGCAIALTADRRVMVDAEVRIGLNETRLGVGLPVIVLETLRATVGTAAARALGLEGTLLTPAEARTAGLVDAIVPQDQLDMTALELARNLADIPPLSYAQVKRAIRRPVIEAVQASYEEDAEVWLDTWFSDVAAAARKAAASRLRER